jgi:hypothetical protein
MKKVIAGTFVAAACAVGLSAQTTPAQTQPMQESKDVAKSVTVSGCLKAGEAADTFILSDLKWSDKATAAVGTSGVVAPAAPVTATALNLVGSPAGTKLSDHVGHQVEVTGTIDKADKVTASPATPPDAAARTQAALNVRSVKMIAATCQTK